MYFKLENSGCSERKGMIQIRYDLFLEKDEHRYEEYIVDGQDTPFLSHFCQFEPSVTNEEILFVGELACELTYREWKENKPHGVRNLPVVFPVAPSLDRKTVCEQRLENIKALKLVRKV